MTTANPKPDARALVAGVLKGLESADYAFLEVAKSSLKGTAGLKIPTTEASKAFVVYVDYVATVESELSDLRTREAKLAEENEKLRGVLSIFINNNWITVHKGHRLNQLTIALNDEQLEQFRNLLESKSSPTPLA